MHEEYPGDVQELRTMKNRPEPTQRQNENANSALKDLQISEF